MITPEDLAKAGQIYDSFNNKCNSCHYGGEVNDRTDFVNAIAAALAEARTTPKPAAEVVEAFTADGFPIKVGDRIWFNGEISLGDEETDWAEVCRIDEGPHVIFRPTQRITNMVPELCYKTKASARAALAAQSARGGRIMARPDYRR